MFTISFFCVYLATIPPASHLVRCWRILQDVVVLELLLSTGLRLSELCVLSKDSFLLNDTSVNPLTGSALEEQVV